MAANPIRYINPDPAANVITVGDDVLGEHVQVSTLPQVQLAGSDGVERNLPESPLEARDRETNSLLLMILTEMQHVRLLLESIASTNGE